MNLHNYTNIICKLMCSGLNNESLNIEKYLDDPVFLNIIKEQTFQPYLYKVFKSSKTRKYYIQASIINDQFEQLKNKIELLLIENKIDYMFLKGTFLKHLYPDPNLRQMGDIDLLVREKSFDKTIQLLINSGFKYHDKTDYHVALYYKNLCVEVHNKILHDITLCNNKFCNPFNIAIKSDYSYSLNINDTFLFIILHYIKHLKNGAGLREICDLYLILKNYDIDLDYIKHNLSIEKNEKFLDSLLSEIEYIFNFKKYKFNRISNIDELIHFSLISGIHGHGIHNTHIKNQFFKSKNNKFLFLLSKLFIPPKQMFKKYSWTKSIILLPLGYFVRFFHLIFKKNKDIKEIFVINENDNILKKFGINN